MAFYKYLLPSWKRNIEETSTANGTVLTALQMALSDAEQQALESKFQLVAKIGCFSTKNGDEIGPRRQSRAFSASK